MPTAQTPHFHDTASGERKALVPGEGNSVGIYACGPTVYNRIHVGNARPFVVFSWLKRYLQAAGYDVTFVVNVTDVNDKIYAAAVQQGVSSTELAAEMTAHYRSDTDALGLGRPDHEPLVTTTMDAIVDLIAALIEREAAYVVEGDVYFRVRSDDAYGSLSHRKLDDMNQGEDEDLVGTSRKEDPADFALWKAEKEGEDTAWDAPWGRGRPGWHIECSAMAEELLGLNFQIHGGGSDLVFPHHENEAAQTRCGRGQELAQIWMHNGMLEMRGADGASEKMAKSVGNVTLLPDAIEEHGRDTLLLFFATGHYRQPLVYSPETLADAAARLRRIRELARGLSSGSSPESLRQHRDAFFAALAEDFNTPQALAALAAWVAGAREIDGAGCDDLVEMLSVFGLENVVTDRGEGPSVEALELLAQREQARADKDWATADQLRDELQALGWAVRDGAGGAELVPLS